MAHNVRDLRCRLGVAYFLEVMGELRKMVDRFVEVLDCLDTAFIDDGLLDELGQPGVLGAVRVGGLDINRPRTRAVMEAVLALSPNPRGFTASELAAKVRPLLDDDTYSPSRPAYDLRKVRSKELVEKLPRSRRYTADASGLRAMAALLIVRDRVFRPLFAAAPRTAPAPRPSETSVLDLNYHGVHNEMQAPGSELSAVGRSLSRRGSYIGSERAARCVAFRRSLRRWWSWVIAKSIALDIEGPECRVPDDLAAERHPECYNEDTTVAARQLKEPGYILFHVESTRREHSFRWTGDWLGGE